MGCINVGFVWPWGWFSQEAPSKNSTSGPNPDVSLIDFCDQNGLPSDFRSRAELGKEMGIPGKPGSAGYNTTLLKALQAKRNANGGKL